MIQKVTIWHIDMIKANTLSQTFHFVMETKRYIITTPPPNPNFNGYDYVDLALPSGTLWSTCNVGASKPSDYGLYFAWGDTQGYTSDQVGNGDGKKKFSPDYSDYKWGTYQNFTKYTVSAAILELEDDAAHVHMGGD